MTEDTKTTKNSAEEMVKVNIEGSGLSYQGKVNVRTASTLISICLGNEDNSTLSKSAELDQSSENNDIRLSSGEFIENSNAKRNPDKILALAAYLKEKEGIDSFTKEDIKSKFAEAGEPMPSNFSRDFKWTKDSKWISSHPNKEDKFYVTRKGYNVVDNKFPSEAIKKTKQK